MASSRSIPSPGEIQEPEVEEKSNPDDASSPEVSDLEVGPVDGKSEPKSNINEISWESDDDPSNPKNWSSSRKWQNLGVISIMSLTTSVITSFLNRSFNGRPQADI